MKIISLKQRLRIIIALFIVLIIGILIVVVYPTATGILRLQKEINVTEVFLETQYQRSQRLSSKDQNLEEIGNKTSAFTALTISPDSELSLIQTFEEIAERHTIDQHLNVSFQSEPHETTKLPYYEFTFLNHGQYEDHLAYLHTVGLLPYIVDIDAVDMQGKEQSNTKAVKVTLKFSARIYAKTK